MTWLIAAFVWVLAIVTWVRPRSDTSSGIDLWGWWWPIIWTFGGIAVAANAAIEADIATAFAAVGALTLAAGEWRARLTAHS